MPQLQRPSSLTLIRCDLPYVCAQGMVGPASCGTGEAAAAHNDTVMNAECMYHTMSRCHHYCGQLRCTAAVLQCHHLQYLNANCSSQVLECSFNITTCIIVNVPQLDHHAARIAACICSNTGRNCCGDVLAAISALRSSSLFGLFGRVGHGLPCVEDLLTAPRLDAGRFVGHVIHRR